MTQARLKISSPWVTYTNKLKALFGGDPEITIDVNYETSEGPSVTIATDNGDKAAALMRLLPDEKVYGNVILDIYIDGNPADRAFVTAKELFEVAFDKNPAFAYCVAPAEEYWFPDFCYVVFKNCVVQFFNDNLDDPHGLISTLYQDIAAEIFEEADIPGAHFCTDTEVGNVGKPLGEWP